MISFVPDDCLAEGEFPGGENVSSIDNSQEKGEEETEVEQCDVKGVEWTHPANSESSKKYKNTAKMPIFIVQKLHRDYLT